MGFFDNIGKTLSGVGQTTLKKGVGAANSAKYSLGINDEERKLEKAYCELGKKYFELHSEDYEESMAPIMDSIFSSQEKIKELQEAIKEIKGFVKCEKCGGDVPPGVAFCPGCGAPVKKEEPEPLPEPFVPRTEKIICPNCKSVLMPGTNFCTKCGTRQDLTRKPENNVPQGNPYGYQNGAPQGNPYGYQNGPQGNPYGYQSRQQGNPYEYQNGPQGNPYGYQNGASQDNPYNYQNNLQKEESFGYSGSNSSSAAANDDSNAIPEPAFTWDTTSDDTLFKFDSEE